MTVHRVGRLLRPTKRRHRCDPPSLGPLDVWDLYECPTCRRWCRVAVVPRGQDYAGMRYWRRISRRRALRKLAHARSIIPPEHVDNSSQV